ncbi:TPA: pilus assembly protein PilZ, partial [Pseudomonas aeruginosa]|nr:pilus assembly protein PilZ [Pseudomonas aeruginosa]
MQRARLPESACCMSRHLPSSSVSPRSLAGHAPAVLCVLLLALLSASLASQTRSLRRELAELPAAAAPAPPANPSAASRAALAGLFGGAPSPRGATAGERLQLRLL